MVVIECDVKCWCFNPYTMWALALQMEMGPHKDRAKLWPGWDLNPRPWSLITAAPPTELQGQILGRLTRTRARFSNRKTVRACKPASFWWEKRDTVVSLVVGFALFRAVDVQLLVKLNFIFWEFLQLRFGLRSFRYKVVSIQVDSMQIEIISRHHRSRFDTCRKSIRFNSIFRPVAGGEAGGSSSPPRIFRFELNSATKVEFFPT